MTMITLVQNIPVVSLPKQTKPTTDSTITTDADTVEDSSDDRYSQEIVDLQKD